MTLRKSWQPSTTQGWVLNTIVHLLLSIQKWLRFCGSHDVPSNSRDINRMLPRQHKHLCFGCWSGASAQQRLLCYLSLDWKPDMPLSSSLLEINYCWIVWLYFGYRLWFWQCKAFNWWLNMLFKWKTRRENVLILLCSFQSLWRMLWRFICKSPVLHVGTDVWPVLSTSAVFIYYLHVVSYFLPACLLPCNTPARVILRIAPFIDVWPHYHWLPPGVQNMHYTKTNANKKCVFILCFSVQAALFICNKSGCLSYLTSFQ